MLKLFSILALIATVYSIGVGGITKQETVPDKVLEIADWCTAQMTTLMNQKEAVFQELRVRDVTTQVVAGVNYRFTIDYLVEVNGKKMIESCTFGVNERPWENYRVIFEGPDCIEYHKP